MFIKSIPLALICKVKSTPSLSVPRECCTIVSYFAPTTMSLYNDKNRKPLKRVVFVYGNLEEKAVNYVECKKNNSKNKKSIFKFLLTFKYKFMKEGYVIRDQTLPHFIAATVVNWVDVFTRKAYKDNIIELVGLYLTNQFYIIFPFNNTRKQAVSLRSFPLFRSAVPSHSHRVWRRSHKFSGIPFSIIDYPLSTING